MAKTSVVRRVPSNIPPRGPWSNANLMNIEEAASTIDDSQVAADAGIKRSKLDTAEPNQVAFQYALGSPFTVASSNLVENLNAEKLSGAALDSLFQAEAGKNIKLVAGVIRNSGSGWGLIIEGHGSANVDSVSNDSNAITIDYTSLGATKPVAFVVGPDETYALQNITVGASVGDARALLSVSSARQIGGYVSYNSGSWHFDGEGLVSASFSSGGLLTVVHDPVPGPTILRSVTGSGGAYVPQVRGSSSTSVDIGFYDFAGTLASSPVTDMEAFVSIGSSGKINPNDLSDPSGNFWFVGAFEV